MRSDRGVGGRGCGVGRDGGASLRSEAEGRRDAGAKETNASDSALSVPPSPPALRPCAPERSGAPPSLPTPDLSTLFDLLHGYYGPQHWWPAESDFEMIVGAFLTQNTSWTNVEKAVQALREVGWLTPSAIRNADEVSLAERLRPAGCFRQKAKRIKGFVAHLDERNGGELGRLFAQDTLALRAELLGLEGVGPETADCIVLYAARLPIFVVDAYTRRLFDRLGVLNQPTYDEAQKLAHASLPPDAARFNEFHALIVRHAKAHCRAKPRCVGCPLAEVCRYPSGVGA